MVQSDQAPLCSSYRQRLFRTPSLRYPPDRRPPHHTGRAFCLVAEVNVTIRHKFQHRPDIQPPEVPSVELYVIVTAQEAKKLDASWVEVAMSTEAL